MKPNKTFIQVSKDTREGLKDLKMIPAESYDHLIKRMIKPLLKLRKQKKGDTNEETNI
jgi:hypothetical protein